MPSPKRWFPTSRDINHDPELWELTDTFGDRSLRTWMEILAILDRVDNFWRLSGQWLAGLSRTTRQKPASIQRQIGWMVAKEWLVVVETLADGSPASYSARNYWKYHKRQESKGAKQESITGSKTGPSLPYPNLSYHSSSYKRAVDSVENMEPRGRGSEGFQSVVSIIQELKSRSISS